jgi:hypothetical protein
MPVVGSNCVGREAAASERMTLNELGTAILLLRFGYSTAETAAINVESVQTWDRELKNYHDWGARFKR